MENYIPIFVPIIALIIGFIASPLNKQISVWTDSKLMRRALYHEIFTVYTLIDGIIEATLPRYYQNFQKSTILNCVLKSSYEKREEIGKTLILQLDLLKDLPAWKFAASHPHVACRIPAFTEIMILYSNLRGAFEVDSSGLAAHLIQSLQVISDKVRHRKLERSLVFRSIGQTEVSAIEEWSS